MDTSLGTIGGANNSNNLSPSSQGVGTAATNNLINGLNSLGLQSLQNNHFSRNEIQVRSLTHWSGSVFQMPPPHFERNTCSEKEAISARATPAVLDKHLVNRVRMNSTVLPYWTDTRYWLQLRKEDDEMEIRIRGL